VVLAWLVLPIRRRRPGGGLSARPDGLHGASALVVPLDLGALPMPSTCDLPTPTAHGGRASARRIWYLGNRYTYRRSVPADVVKVEIDVRQNFPDVRRGNNVWTKP